MIQDFPVKDATWSQVILLFLWQLLAELLLVPSPLIRPLSMNKHRFSQWLVFDDVGTEMKGRNFSLVCVSLLTSSCLDLSVYMCGNWAPGSLSQWFHNRGAHSGSLLIMMLLKYCLHSFPTPLFNRHWLSLYARFSFPKHMTRCISNTIGPSDVCGIKEYVRGELVFWLQFYISLTYLFFLFKRAFIESLTYLDPWETFIMQKCFCYLFLEKSRPNFFSLKISRYSWFTILC